MDDFESFENLRTSLEDQNTKIHACSGWREVDEKFILDKFVFEEAAPMTDEQSQEVLLQRMLDMFSQKPPTDPLSEESLKEQFPNFPDNWYIFLAEAARDKFKVLEAEKKEIEEVTTKMGNFKISFN